MNIHFVLISESDHVGHLFIDFPFDDLTEPHLVANAVSSALTGTHLATQIEGETYKIFANVSESEV